MMNYERRQHMLKKLIVLCTAVLVLLSLSACRAGRETPGGNGKSISSQPQKDDKSAAPQKNVTPDASKTSGDKTLIDDMMKTIKDMGDATGSLEDPTDNDLAIPDPQ
jgi:protein involved in sex pheromone biosynthesis